MTSKIDLAQNELDLIEETVEDDMFDALFDRIEEIVRANPDLVVLYRPSDLFCAYQTKVVTLSDYEAHLYSAESVYKA